MPATRLRFSEPWMTPTEKRLVNHLSTELTRFFEAYGVDLSPLLRLRARDVVLGALWVRGLESAYGTDLPVSGDDANGAGDLKHRAFFLDTHGKAQERLRKAMKELEDHCARAGTPVDVNLANAVKPVMEKAPAVFSRLAELQAEIRAGRDARRVPPEEGDPLPKDEFV